MGEERNRGKEIKRRWRREESRRGEEIAKGMHVFIDESRGEERGREERGREERRENETDRPQPSQRTEKQIARQEYFSYACHLELTYSTSSSSRDRGGAVHCKRGEGIVWKQKVRKIACW